MIRVYRYRLYPSNAQRLRMESVLETTRRFYNGLLAERKEAWESEQRRVSKVEQLRRVKEVKATNPYAKDVHSHILQVVAADLDKAFQAFFRRVKAGEEPGYPRFKGRNRWKSFGLKEYRNGFSIDGRRLRVSGIGRIPVRWHRALPEGAKIKTARFIRKAGKWYVALACEVEPAAPLPETGKEVGIDVGVASLAILSTGEVVENPGWYRREQAALRRTQRAVARKKKGGKNRRKAVAVLQRQHDRIANCRRDYIDKLVARLVRDYDRIAVEDLRVRNMVKNRRLAKSILDSAWSTFAQRLLDKAESAGRKVVFVDPAYTSRDCSCCGYRKSEMPLSVRAWVCPECGAEHDRDTNAALNILARGQRAWAPSQPVGRFAQEAAAL